MAASFGRTQIAQLLCNNSNSNSNLRFRVRIGGYATLKVPALRRSIFHRISVRRGATSEAHDIATSVTDSTFSKIVLESDVAVLVEFWAPWCGPCRTLAPLIDDVARQYAGKLRCIKLNTDDCPNLATEYGIRSIPTMVIFVKGVRKDTVVGAVAKSSLMSVIDKYVV